MGVFTRYVQSLPAEEKSVFPGLSLEKYEQLFRRAREKLELSTIALTPHVVRHSGPSNDAFHQVRNLSEIQAQGRWRCLCSVLRYEKLGRLLHHQNKLSDKIQKAMTVAAWSLQRALAEIRF
eukprot:TRINITY_DN13403_c0_g1_i1.p1 TRINITY_DN13403_c0_g1~~TRINITY_DN13403_c0_g1_i1.p1  ORF type:complete len:122 (+),score=12.43 TRINITY_DN13403_c0_g1_i1:508-873(+)